MVAGVGWKWVELIKGKDTEASGTVGVWESESQGHLLWSSVLTGSTTREEPREAELARTMLPVCGPWETLDQCLSTLCPVSFLPWRMECDGNWHSCI